MRGALEKQLGFLKRFAERGGAVVTGSDAAGKVLTPGYAVHREMELLVRGGFSRLAAIRATRADRRLYRPLRNSVRIRSSASMISSRPTRTAIPVVS